MPQLTHYFFALYRFIFCRPVFYSFNTHLFKLSLRGLGVLNSEVASATGEDFLLRHLAERWQPQVVVDVGANTDAYGVEQFTNAQIFAIEPHPETFGKLKQKFAKLKRVTAVHAAVSNTVKQGKLWDFAATAELKATQPTSQLSSLDKTVIEELHGQKTQSFAVPVVTLDAFAKQHKIAYIDFLKIDTEGHELQVLQGAKKLLADNKVGMIQFEFNEMNVWSRTFLYDFIKILPGYRFYRLLPRGLYPLGEYRPLTHEVFGFQNVLAVPRELEYLVEDVESIKSF